MYSSKQNVNILTSLLVAFDIRQAVVCPGSRNAPIVHNLHECPEIHCHSVTDERSAGFYALGMCQVLHEPVVVCVTSGTPLLNVLPAVAEAFYQHLPLIVISADRPVQWIGQKDGQTLPQAQALDGFVRKAVVLSEPHCEEDKWYCNRLVNEALVAAKRGSGGPVHINVPLSEPLFEWTTPHLPQERKVAFASPFHISRSDDRVLACIHPLLNALHKAAKPVIVVGQMKGGGVPLSLLSRLNDLHYTIFHESLGTDGVASCMDEAITLAGEGDDFLPDFILYIGNTLVSKRIKMFLRKAKQAACWAVNPDGELYDTFMNLSGVLQAQPTEVLESISQRGNEQYFARWQSLQRRVLASRERFVPTYSQMQAVRLFEEKVASSAADSLFHYANSMPVRLANIYSKHYVYCNRGVNGIEGTLSTAAGCSLISHQLTYCVIGDLSFFYDQNALWNASLRGNLRILLLNNGGGAIFHQLPGLTQSAACDTFIAAAHHVTAAGICQENGIIYHAAHDSAALSSALEYLTTASTERPVLVEVFTDKNKDIENYQAYYQALT